MTVIGKVRSDTMTDRTIEVRMARKLAGEVKEPATSANLDLATGHLRQKCRRWAADHELELRALAKDPSRRLGGDDDRAIENWDPLFAIAEVAGGEWPAKALSAARAVSANRAADDDEDRILVLTHIRHIMADAEIMRDHPDQISTDDLLNALVARDDGPWAERWATDVAAAGVKLKRPAGALAELLKPFGIKPKQMRIRGQKVRGYERSKFEEAWTRYLEPEPSHLSDDHEEDGTDGTDGTPQVAVISDGAAGSSVPSDSSEAGGEGEELLGPEEVQAMFEITEED